MDPKVIALRDFAALLRSEVRAGCCITQAEALGELHRFCDKLWPPARLFNGKVATP